MPAAVPAPDPAAARRASLAELARLHLPLPPPNFPLVWEAGDTVALRSRDSLEGRAAILNVLLARSFGMPAGHAVRWLLAARLLDELTPPEWRFVASGQGDPQAFAIQLDALYALAWLLGLTASLTATEPPAGGLIRLFPDLRVGEPYGAWRARTLTALRAPTQAAAQLDLHYCLDWAYLEAERRRLPLPGMIDSNAVGQRRWALEWGVVLSGPYQDPPPAWSAVDLGP